LFQLGKNGWNLLRQQAMSNKIIYALSSLGEVTIDKFNDLFKTLYIPEYGLLKEKEEINHRRQISQVYDSLGFCEFDYSKRKVFMCPPAMVLLPSFGLPKVLLTGARTPALVKKIKKAIDKRKDKVIMHVYYQSNNWLNVPDVITVEADSAETLRNITDETGILLSAVTPVAWEIANYCISLVELEEKLNFVNREDINWGKKVFDEDRLRFCFSKEVQKNGYILAEYTHPLTKQKMHWLWSGSEAAEIDRDWGRYLALKKCNKNVIFYNRRYEYIGVPLTVPLPRILARAVALCSGKAPLINYINCTELGLPSDLFFQFYAEVPEVVAKIVSQKVGQKLIFNKLDLLNIRR